jgi:putative transposase
LIDTPNYLFACFVYIEMNPVRARMVAGPQHYPWSSFQANALGRNDPVLTPHEQYHKLGGTAEKRRQAYKALFSKYFSDGTLASIRDSIENDLPLGSSQFKEDIERKIQRPVSRQSHGGDRRSRSFQVHAQV